MLASHALKNLIAKSWQRLLPREATHEETCRRLWQRRGQKWSMEGASLHDGSMKIWGWALLPEAQRARAVFTWNDRPFEVIQFPVARHDVAKVFPFVPAAGESGFACWARIGDMRGAPITVRCVDRATGRSLFGDAGSFHYVFPKTNEAFPDAPRRTRVHGNPLEEHFRLVGATTFMRLRAALRRTVGRDVTDFQSVLDWGCGCGRVARYFEGAMPGTLTGVDVDADNIQWCQQNLPFGTFLHIPLHPPTRLAHAAFDLVIGISVFTHLKERAHEEWLEELHRITRPGALLLLTFHGDGAAVMRGLSAEQLRERDLTGQLSLPHGGYDAQLSEEDYYRDIYHTTSFIRRSWSRRFQVLEMRPSYIGQQDLVVLRRR